jgi:hypothetical protein
VIGESQHVAVDAPLEVHERGRHLVQPAHRTVGGEPVGIVFSRPLSAGFVVVPDLVAFLQQFDIEAAGGRAAAEERGSVEERGEPGFDRHVPRLRRWHGPGQTDWDAVHGCPTVLLKNFG